MSVHLSGTPVPKQVVDMLTGRRVGPFVIFVDGDCRRHAVRLASVLALSDGDEQQETSIMQLPGGRAVRICAPLEEVLSWFCCGGGA